jgi:hypothetical protein
LAVQNLIKFPLGATIRLRKTGPVLDVGLGKGAVWLPHPPNPDARPLAFRPLRPGVGS